MAWAGCFVLRTANWLPRLATGSAIVLAALLLPSGEASAQNADTDRWLEELRRQRQADELSRYRKEQLRYQEEQLDEARKMRELLEEERRESRQRQQDEEERKVEAERQRREYEESRLMELRGMALLNAFEARMAKCKKLGEYGSKTVFFDPTFVLEADFVRADFASEIDVPFFHSLWYHCEDAEISVDGKKYEAIGAPTTLGWQLGEKACGSRFRLHRWWSYIGDFKNGAPAGLDLDSVVVDGTIRYFDMTDHLSVTRLTVDCRKRKFLSLDDPQTWRVAKRGTIARAALDLACSAKPKSPIQTTLR